MEMIRNKGPGFVMVVSPEKLISVETTIPLAFFEKYKNNIPRMVNLCFENGTTFQCRFCKGRKCFLGMVRVFEHFRVVSSSVFVFEMLQVGNFLVTILGSHGVGCTYTLSKVFYPYTPHKDHNKQLKRSNTEKEKVWTIKDHHNRGLLYLNIIAGGERTIELELDESTVVIEDKDVEQLQLGGSKIILWEPGWYLYFRVGRKFWKVGFTKIGSSNYLTQGWNEIVKDLDLEVGDKVVLLEDGNPYHFWIHVYRGFRLLNITTNRDKCMPCQFLKIVRPGFMSNGELYIPLLFWFQQTVPVPTSIILAVDGGKLFNCSQSPIGNKFFEMQHFIQSNKLEVGYVLLFKKRAEGEFWVSIYNQNSMDVR